MTIRSQFVNRNHNTVILLNNDGMGSGDKELRQKLIRTYLTLLLENETLPAAICLYTDGVRLAVTGSPVINLLQAVEANGTRLILCSTCLTHFGLMDQVQVGIVGGMGDIIEAQVMAEKVITL
jgi:sulfur relay (sulfurtransferase) complex TusBCD TusD component (DsrE family)